MNAGGCRISNKSVANAVVSANRKLPAIRAGEEAISRRKNCGTETVSVLEEGDKALSHNADGCLADSKQCRVWILNANTHWKARCNMDPIKSVLDLRQSIADT